MTYTYDPTNRLVSSTHREGGVTQFEYDELDRITKVTAPNGAVTEFEYDPLGRRTKEISPDRGTLTFTYDRADNITSITDGRGITVTITYDELERVISQTFPDTSENVTFSYDACQFGLGRLCARTDESGSYDFGYDAFGNLVEQQHTELGVTYVTAYQYDNGDNIVQMTLPSGRVVDYTRDGVRRIEAIQTTLNGNPQTVVENIQYRADNQVTARTFGNGLIGTREYDLQGRLTRQQLAGEGGFIVDERNYSYDANSNILNIDTNVEDNSYQYDRLDRLTQDTSLNNPEISEGPVSFTYDLNDNRLSRRDGLDPAASDEVDELLTYAEDSNRIQVQDTLSTAINPLADLPDRELVYNDAGRLFQLFEDGNLVAEYIYNADGQRTRKVVHNEDGTTTTTMFHYDLNSNLITETREDGTLVRDYIWQDTTPTAQIDDTGTETISYLHSDHLFTNRLATDDFQGVIWRWEGRAFGNTAAEELAGLSINLRLPGQYFDEETGLHYNLNRYYDQQIGRYITSDPIGLGGGLNTYGYVRSNPLVLSDPRGLLAPCLVPPVTAACASAAVNAIGAIVILANSPIFGDDDAEPPEPEDECPDDRDSECERRRQVEETLCEAIAGPRYPGNPAQAIAICKKAAFQRYVECLRGVPESEWPPLTGVDTPI